MSVQVVVSRESHSPEAAFFLQHAAHDLVVGVKFTVAEHADYVVQIPGYARSASARIFSA